MSKYFETLNKNQKRAVKTTDGAVLVLAGAGSGKTRVITERILYLVERGLARPDEILSITFTNKAAREMKERALNLLRKEGYLANKPGEPAPTVSTFHALGVQILKEENKRAGLPKRFSIYDKADSLKILKEILESKSINPKENPPSKFLSIISKKKGEGLSVENFEAGENPFERNLSSIWNDYQKALSEENALDFGDLLLKPYLLLLKNDDLREKYAGRFKYIQIDEYQDTNKVQYLLAKLLSGGHGNIFAVGDADQNIYSWRGARLENVLGFQKDFKNAKVINLSINYRSSKNIIELAETVIEKNIRRIPKEVETINPEGEPVRVLVTEEEKQEARLIAEMASQKISSGVPAKEIAVLYRTHFQSRVMEEEFLKRGVPYQVLGIKFFERKEVKEVISFIETALNRESITHLKRIINMPPRGVGKVTLLKVLSGKKDGLGPSMQAKVDNFFHLLERIKKSSEKLDPSELVRFVIEETGLKKHYEETEEDRERILNMEELVNIAQKYDGLEPGMGIEKFLDEMAIQTGDEVKDEGPLDAVKLLTVHSAKGLEFDVVFVSGLEEGLFPIARDDDPDEAEEERRLFYVAATRARKNLFLSYAITRKIYGRKELSQPSRFLVDVEHLLEPMTEEFPEEETNYIEI